MAPAPALQLTEEPALVTQERTDDPIGRKARTRRKNSVLLLNLLSRFAIREP